MEDPMLVVSPYTVRSKVSQRDFRTFVSALEGASVPLTKDNLGGLTRLCEEFQFGELTERLSQFRESEHFKEDVTLKDLEAQKRLSALEERMPQRDCEIATLRTELTRVASRGRCFGFANRVRSLTGDSSFWICSQSSSSRWNSVMLSF
jgi:hypothetical protein